MNATEVARQIGSLDAAAGVAIMLAPFGGGAQATARRAFGLGLLVVAWATLAASLVPEDDARRALDRLTSPLAIGVVVALVAAWLLVRLIVSRPWVFFVLLGLALPVRFPVTLGSQSANLLVPLYAVIFLGLAAWIVGRRRGVFDGRHDEPGALDVPIALFGGFTLLSSLWSDDTTEAAVKAVFFYIPFVLLFRLVRALWAQTDAARVLVAATIAMAVPVAVLALGQYVARDIFWNERLEQANIYSRFFRVNGIFFDPNILGRFLVIAILGAVAVAWYARSGRTVAVVGLAAAVCAAGVVVTFSRSSALGLIVGLLILAPRAFGARRTLAVAAVLGIVLGAGAVATSDNVREAVTSVDRLERVSEGRFDLVKGGLEIWADDPVAGTGLGAFATRFESELTPQERRRVVVVISHNAPVTVLTETGVIGFALFVLLGGAAIRALSRAPVGSPGEEGVERSGWVAWTALAMLASIFVHALFYSALFEDPFTWAIAAAGVAAVAAAPATVTAVIRRPRAAEAAAT